MSLTSSATSLAAQIREREISPVEVVQACIDRIEEVNPFINAMVAQRFDLALREARLAERFLQRSRKKKSLPPLFGVPCTIKEFFAVSGMPSTGGLLSKKDNVLFHDATVVARLKAAGAIVLGVTNAPEGGLWMETYNAVYGRTNNPWDPRRTSGGSSGGEAALIACGASPFGIGSDVGGSIRIPAAFCGIAGHKPTGGLIPNTGHTPGGKGESGRFLVSGPLTRRVTDLWPLLQILAGADGHDPSTLANGPDLVGLKRSNPALPGELDFSEITVVPMETNGRTRVNAAMRGEVARCAQVLEDRGARIKQVELPHMRHAMEIWSAMLSEVSTIDYTDILGNGKPVRLMRELAALPFGRSNHTMAALVLLGVSRVVEKLPNQLGRFIEEGQALQAEIEEVLGPNGVLLHPPYSRPAPYHGGAWSTPFDVACTAIFNVLEFPGTQVPTTFDKRNLPLGVQVIGARGQDRLTIGVAAALEEELGGWKPAFVS